MYITPLYKQPSVRENRNKNLIHLFSMLYLFLLKKNNVPSLLISQIGMKLILDKFFNVRTVIQILKERKTFQLQGKVFKKSPKISTNTIEMISINQHSVFGNSSSKPFMNLDLLSDGAMKPVPPVPGRG